MGLGLTVFAFPAVALTGLTRDLLGRRRRRATDLAELRKEPWGGPQRR